MRSLMAVAAREVSERGTLLALAAVISMVPFVAPALGLPPDAREAFAIIVPPTLIAAAAVLCGSSVIARDLGEGRLGFFFARPIPWWSIWGGKLLAAVVLTVATVAILELPVVVFNLIPHMPTAGWWVRVLLPLLLTAIGTAHAGAVAYRSRDNWVALDLAILATLAWVLVRTWRSLVPWGGAPTDPRAVTIAVWTLAISLTVAGAAQVALGRADIRRGRRVLSAVLWTLVGLGTAGFVAYAAWVRTPSPRDIREVRYATAVPQGSWVALAGRAAPARPGWPMLLVDLRSGQFLRLGALGWVQLAFSGDGRVVAWMEPPMDRRDPPRLLVADLTTDHPRPREVPLPVPPQGVRSFTVSADGRRIAAVQADQVSVFDVGSAQTRVSLALRGSVVHEAVFTADGRVRMVRRPFDPFAAADLEVVTLDPDRGRVESTGRLPTPGNPAETWSPDGERLVVVHRPRPAFHARVDVYDARAGAVVASPLTDARGVSALFLADGRLVLAESGATTRLRILDASGEERGTLEAVPRYTWIRLTEIEPGIVGVGYFLGGHSHLRLVDVDRGQILRDEDRLHSAGFWWAHGAPPPGSEGARLLLDDKGELVRYDVRTGERKVLLGGG